MKTTLPALALILGLSAVAQANPTPVTKSIALENCPAPVRETLRKAAAGGKIDKIHETSRDGQALYLGDIDLADDRDQLLEVKPDGAIIKAVTGIAFKDAPEPVRQALAKLAEGEGEIEDVEQVVEGAATTWQAEIDRENAVDWKVRLDAAGKVLSRNEER